MLRFLILLGIFALIACSNEEKTIDAGSLTKVTHQFFSNSRSQDRFVLQFLPAYPDTSRLEYTYLDILSGNLMLTIHNAANVQIYNHKWSVSDCFSMADNHYLSEDQKVGKFLKTVDNFFDSEKFSSIGEIQITGILRSSDSTSRKEIESDTSSIGFSFIQEDFCVMYARKSERAVLLRALRKDILKRYNLLNEPANLSLDQ